MKWQNQVGVFNIYYNGDTTALAELTKTPASTKKVPTYNYIIHQPKHF